MSGSRKTNIFTQPAKLCVRTTMKYLITLHQSEEGYSVSCPTLPGCWSQGKIEEEALASIQEAIHDYLEVLQANLQGVEVREVEVAA